MKVRWILLFALFFIVATAFGDYDISWNTIDGGGGREKAQDWVKATTPPTTGLGKRTTHPPSTGLGAI